MASLPAASDSLGVPLASIDHTHTPDSGSLFSHTLAWAQGESSPLHYCPPVHGHILDSMFDSNSKAFVPGMKVWF